MEDFEVTMNKSAMSAIKNQCYMFLLYLKAVLGVGIGLSLYFWKVMLQVDNKNGLLWTIQTSNLRDQVVIYICLLLWSCVNDT